MVVSYAPERRVFFYVARFLLKLSEQNSSPDPQRYRRANLRPDMETVASN